MEPPADDPAKLPDRPKLLQVMGPGLITGASDDDPSGIATYSQDGAQFGYGLAWTLVFSHPLMVAIQEISARIGRVTGYGIAGNLRRHCPPWLAVSIVAILLVANLINLGADPGAMGAALKLLIHGPTLRYTVAFGVLSAGLQIFTRYAGYISIPEYLCLALFSYVICAFMVDVAWLDVARAIVWPPLSLNAAYLMAIVAVLGTTLSPYLFFWQAGQEVEDGKERAGARPLTRAPKQAHDEFARIRLDTCVGMAIANMFALFIVITTAATLHARGGPTSRRRLRRLRRCAASLGHSHLWCSPPALSAPAR
jgi:NRAMP (natural resistance-associated macrophage protein)-like metal ion transporter